MKLHVIKGSITVALIVGFVLALGVGLPAADKKADKKKVAGAKPAAVARTRKTVKMLDDIYKTAVVLITDKYVHDDDDFPAGSAAIALFGAISKKGWHDVRLIDVTGEPYDPKNVAKDDFEKKAVLELKSGEAYYEEIIQKEGKPYLRAATPVPVVMEKCVMCHAHYSEAQKGEAIGLISYTLPIE